MRSWAPRIALAALAVVAFALHFRPWEVAFLEEWPIAELWDKVGLGGTIDNYAQWSLSRPLHLVLTLVGLAIGGGSPAGIFAVMGVVAAATAALTVWALRPLSRSPWVSLAVAAFVALHPLFPGGYLQRFLPAQTAVLTFVVAAGFLIRWLLDGRRRWMAATFAVLIAGLCVYPGTAAAAPLLAVAVALSIPSSWRRRIVAVVVVVAASALMTVYSLVITKLIAPGGETYEAGNIAQGGVHGPRDFVERIGSTLIGSGLTVVAAVIAVAALGAVLALSGAVPHPVGWLITATALVSPLCTVVFFGNVAWLADIDRIEYATSLGLTAALMLWPIGMSGLRLRPLAVIAAVVILVSVVGGVRGVRHWQPYIALQHQLFQELKPAVEQAHGDEIVVVVDHSGTFGAIYTLPQHYISSASHIMNDDATPVWLCYEKGDPVTGGSTLCATADTGRDPRFVSSYDLPGGEVDIYIGKPESDD
ncbi:hypothetical protein GCM10027515_01250 [Schumannella luteola]